MRKKFFLLTFIMTYVVYLSAQVKQSSIPRSFIIGEHQEMYDKLSMNHEDLLTVVCANSMDMAYDTWTDVLVKLEQYSQTKGYDIKGIKIWINIFWAADGKIDYIVYHPKPNSKNTEYENLTKILIDFIPTYNSILKHSKPYSHYGSASFPIHGLRVGKS